MIQTYIFDLDGTLLDSMHIWDDVPQRYCERTGLPYDPHMHETFANMSLTETSHCLQEIYGVDRSDDAIIADINACVEEKYCTEVQLKQGAKECIEKLLNKQKKIVLLTACDAKLAVAALKRTGIFYAFQDILTCEQAGLSKTEPSLFTIAATHFHTDPTSCVFIEDSLHAIESIKLAGYKAWGIYDSANENDWEEITRNSDAVFKDLYELEEFI